MKARQITAMLLAGMMVLGMTACGAKPQTDTQETPQTQSEDSQAEDSQAQAEDTQDDTQPSSEELAEIDEEEVDQCIDLYLSVLDQHYQAVSEQWNAEKLAEEGLSPLLTYCYEDDALQNIGYAFLDIDADGSCELFIEPLAGDDFVEQMVFEMYTCKNDEITQVFCGTERDNYYLSECEEGAYIISNYASSGAGQTDRDYYTFAENDLVLVQSVSYDATENPDNPWSISGEDGEVTEETAQSIIESYESCWIQPSATNFSLYEKIHK